MTKTKRIQPHRARQQERSSPLYPYRLMLRNLNLLAWTKRLTWTILGLILTGALIAGNDRSFQFLGDTLFAVAAFFLGGLGFLQFYRREMYVLRKTRSLVPYRYELSRGTWARVNGIGMMILGWGLLAALIYSVFCH